MREHRRMCKHRYLRLRWPTGCFVFFPLMDIYLARIALTHRRHARRASGSLSWSTDQESAGKGARHWLHPDFWRWAPEPTSGYKMRDIIYYCAGVPPPAARLPEGTF